MARSTWLHTASCQKDDADIGSWSAGRYDSPMGRFWGTVVAAAVVALSLAEVRAHSGGTDRFGCHVESATGVRHCHGEETEAIKFVPTLEGGLEVGRIWVEDDIPIGGFFGATYIQHDGSPLFMGGIAGYWTLGAVTPFVDISAGVAWIARTNAFLALRISGGIQVPLFPIGNKSSAYLKLGAFSEILGDGINAEPLGASLSIGAAL